jgi:hypothetical protein
MNGNVTPVPYPHPFNDCDVGGRYDADMQAIHPGVGERPARWCSRCAGDQLTGLKITLSTVTVFPLDRPGQLP